MFTDFSIHQSEALLSEGVCKKPYRYHQYLPEPKYLLIQTPSLREKREARGLTMRDLGDLLGKPHSFVAKTECGQRRLDVVEFFWYCRIFDSDPVEGVQVILRS